MPISYSLNGSLVVHGVESDWERRPIGYRLSGNTSYSTVAINRWRVPEMDGTTFDSLRALAGSVLSSLETNDFSARNSGATYSDPIMNVINATHNGIRLENVQVEFEVRIGAFSSAFSSAFGL